MKTQGVTAGVHDLIIILPDAKMIMLEMKDVKGVVSANQKKIHTQVKALGHTSMIAYSAEEALDLLGAMLND